MKRDYRIDILRTLAILLIVLAHVLPPSPIFEFRTFDVPLMTFLMGSSFKLSFDKHRGTRNYLDYLWSRIKRLLLPTWLFLVVYFVVFSSLHLLKINCGIIDLKNMAMSFSLIGGIGYVWIIRVFLVVALFSPFIVKIVPKIRSSFQLLGLELTLIFFQSGTVWISNRYLEGVPHYQLVALLIFESTGYLIVALVGMWAVNQDLHNLLLSSVGNILTFMVLAFINHFSSINAQKYPPSGYYLVYGIMMSLLLMTVLSVIKVHSGKYINWFSKYSLELYYWHIFPVTIVMAFLPSINWAEKFVLVLGVALVITRLQVKFLPKLLKPIS